MLEIWHYILPRIGTMMLSPYYTKYGRSQKYDAEFRAAEKRARKKKLHIWGNPELTKNIFKAEIEVRSKVVSK